MHPGWWPPVSLLDGGCLRTCWAQTHMYTLLHTALVRQSRSKVRPTVRWEACRRACEWRCVGLGHLQKVPTGCPACSRRDGRGEAGGCTVALDMQVELQASCELGWLKRSSGQVLAAGAHLARLRR